MNRKSKGPKTMAALGRKGGLARVPKGTAMLSSDERKERAHAAVTARWKRAREQAVSVPAASPKLTDSGRLSDA